MPIALLLIAAGCGDANVIRVGGSEGVVLPTDRAAQLLRPCSRERPLQPDGYWVPTAADVQALEQELPRFLKSNPIASNARTLNPLASYKRQYAGVVRGGHRSIYVNFFTYYPVGMDDWKTEPVVVCDGGSNFFGAEFDVASRQFTYLAYNGVG